MSDHSPTPKQQRYLRRLAEERGVSFTPPRTRAEASRTIDELKRRAPESRAEQRHDRRLVQDQLAAAGDGARVRDHEVQGYGSNATWAARS